MSPAALVLCYHAISDDWRCGMSASAAQLERHVRALLRRGYAPVTFSAAADGGHGGRCFAVTFDDAFASVRDHALPILQRLGVPATVFAVTEFADRGRALRWPGLEPWADGPHAHELRPMRWSDLRALQRAGWEIGSHTVTHPRLPELADDQLSDELRISRRRCEQMLDRPCRLIAYPYGAVDARVTAAAAAAGYVAGAALGPPGAATSLPMRAPRVGVAHRDRPWRFSVKTLPATLALRARVGV
jgi:peptidoglycan/xylan/chitin deacetylase (PgdA/CDA1 family)